MDAPTHAERPDVWEWGRRAADLAGLPAPAAQALPGEGERLLYDPLGVRTQPPQFSEGARAFRQR